MADVKARRRVAAGIDVSARDYLSPLADMVDRESVLERYATVLHLLNKQAIDRGGGPWQEAALVIRLRNELVHYKSRWGHELDRSKLFQSLQGENHRRPPYLEGTLISFHTGA